MKENKIKISKENIGERYKSTSKKIIEIYKHNWDKTNKYP